MLGNEGKQGEKRWLNDSFVRGFHSIEGSRLYKGTYMICRLYASVQLTSVFIIYFDLTHCRTIWEYNCQKVTMFWTTPSVKIDNQFKTCDTVTATFVSRYCWWILIHCGLVTNIVAAILVTWARFLSLTRSKLRQCSANHRAGYFSNLACD